MEEENGDVKPEDHEDEEVESEEVESEEEESSEEVESEKDELDESPSFPGLERTQTGRQTSIFKYYAFKDKGESNGFRILYLIMELLSSLQRTL